MARIGSEIKISWILSPILNSLQEKCAYMQSHGNQSAGPYFETL